MLANFRGWEWIIILVIVVLLFGVGRISKVAGELGKSISAFRDGLKGDEKPVEKADEKTETKTDSTEQTKEEPK